MRKNRYSTKDYVLMALMISLGLVLQIADNMLNFTVIPGGKLGLSNIVSLKNIFLFGGFNAVIIGSIRALLGSFLYGGLSSVPYSLFGAILSIFSMSLIKKYLYPKVSEIGISIIGAFVHNFTQVVVASVIFQNTALLSYSSPLTLLSVFTGFLIGVEVKVLNKKF